MSCGKNYGLLRVKQMLLPWGRLLSISIPSYPSQDHYRLLVSLEGYERILPGSAERIFTMAEKQLEHRMQLEKVVIEGGSRRADMGIYAAVVVEGMFLATSCYLAHLGLTADALKVVGGSAIGLLGAFGFGTLSRRSERIKKKEVQSRDEEE